MEIELIITIGLGIFGFCYFGYCIWWITNDLENKINKQKEDIINLKNEIPRKKT